MFKNNNVTTTESFDAAVSGGDISSEDLLKLYDGWAQTYDEQMSQMGWATPKNVAKVLVEVVDPPKNARILDVAAGTGLICKCLHEYGYSNFDALDPSQEMLAVAKTRNIYTNFYQSFVGGGANLPYQKESYDVVVMSGAFVDGHCPVDSWDDMMDAIKPGGHVVCSMTEKYLREVPAFEKMEEYVEEMLKRKNGVLIDRRVIEKSLLFAEAIIVWVVKKLA